MNELTVAVVDSVVKIEWSTTLKDKTLFRPFLNRRLCFAICGTVTALLKFFIWKCRRNIAFTVLSLITVTYRKLYGSEDVFHYLRLLL